MLQQQIVREIVPMEDKPLLCPNAQPDMEGSRIIGVIGGTVGTAKGVAFLNEHLAASDELLSGAAPARPTEVFRFAAHCEEWACRHYDGAKCHLATRLIQIMPIVTNTLPTCLIRSQCRWFEQEGKSACIRCPQVMTEGYQPSEDFLRAALGEILPSGERENIAHA